jgi:hypothetical protein
VRMIGQMSTHQLIRLVVSTSPLCAPGSAWVRMLHRKLAVGLFQKECLMSDKRSFGCRYMSYASPYIRVSQVEVEPPPRLACLL